VIVLGTAWAVPLAGFALARLGARVVRVENPHRDDPFPLRATLARDQSRVALDLDDAADRDAFVALLESADVVVDGNTPRVFANVGLDDNTLRRINPRLSVVRLAAFAREDRPGYGLAAECRGGWAARREPPRLARSSVADPVGGLLAALAALDALGRPGSRARVSLEGAVGLLLSATSSA
jgi:formyl-CoA transferase